MSWEKARATRFREHYLCFSVSMIMIDFALDGWTMTANTRFRLTLSGFRPTLCKIILDSKKLSPSLSVKTSHPSN